MVSPPPLLRAVPALQCKRCDESNEEVAKDLEEVADDGREESEELEDEVVEAEVDLVDEEVARSVLDADEEESDVKHERGEALAVARSEELER